MIIDSGLLSWATLYNITGTPGICCLE